MNPTVGEDPKLILRARQDPAAFRLLYEQWIHRVYRYILIRVGLKAEAEDLTAQVFLQVFRSLPRYRHDGRFEAWLFTIVRNQVRLYFRAPHRSISLEDLAFEPPAEDASTLDADPEDVRRLRRALARLPELDSELIRLRYAAGLSFAEMAAVLGKSEDAVKKSLYRLQNRLLKMMEGCHD
jgi:RNA polymerase sigma-70 factor (ECF subfamily)